MATAPPPDPDINDVWIDDKGDMQRFDGVQWLPYLDVPDLGDPPLEPQAAEKADNEDDG